MLPPISNSSLSWELLLQVAAEAFDWRWALICVLEFVVCGVLWRLGFRFRRIPEYALIALAAVRSFLKD